jgi:hypothetical protein
VTEPLNHLILLVIVRSNRISPIFWYRLQSESEGYAAEAEVEGTTGSSEEQEVATFKQEMRGIRLIELVSLYSRILGFWHDRCWTARFFLAGASACEPLEWFTVIE